jgi:hypothetical protein
MSLTGKSSRSAGRRGSTKIRSSSMRIAAAKQRVIAGWKSQSKPAKPRDSLPMPYATHTLRRTKASLIHREEGHKSPGVRLARIIARKGLRGGASAAEARHKFVKNRLRAVERHG